MPPRTPAQRARQLELKIAKLRAQLAEAEAARRELPAASAPAAPPAPAALTPSEVKLQFILDMLPVGVSILDEEHRLVYANPSLERLLGLSREALQTGHYRARQYLRPDGTPQPPEEFASVRARREGRPVSEVETGVVAETGDTIWTSVSAAPVDLPGWSVVILTHEVTARRQAELDLRAHQQNLRALIENTDGSIWSIDRHYRMIVGNTRYLESVGAALGRPLTPGEDVLALPLPPAALAEWRGYYDRALRGEQFSVEVLTRFTAQPRHVEYRFNPIRTAAGEVVGVTVFGRDVTERQQAQARLTKLAERLELAVRAAGLGIWEWDIQKNELIWDDQMYALYGVQRADFAHDYDAWLHGLHPEDRALSDTVSRQAVSGEKDYDTEFRVCWPDGQVRILQAKASVIRDAAGRPLRMIGVNVDITERRQAEDQLRASERRFRNFFELGTVGMAITSPEKGWVEYNDRLCEMLGYPREALPALTWAQLTHPEDLPADLAYFNRVAAGEIDGYALDKRFLRQDGTVLPVSLSVHCLRRPDGSIDHFAAVLQDLTERQQAEAALRESEYNLQEAQVIAGLGSYVMDIAAGRWRGSVVLDAIFGIDAAYDHSVAGWSGLIHPADQAPMLAYLQAVIERGQDFDREYRIRRPNDQAERWVHALGRLDYDAAGRPVTMRGAIQDITERKHIAQALQESETRYRNLIDNAPDAIFINRDNRLVFVNPACLRLFGAQRPEELLGRPPLELVHPDDQAAVEERIRWLQATGQPVPAREQRMRRLDGSVVTVEASAAPFQDQGRRAIHVTLRDITARQQAEAALRESENLLRESHVIAGLGSYVLDIATGWWRSSELLDELFGIDAAYVRSVDGWLNLIHPADRAMMAAYFGDEVLGQGRRFDKEYRIVRPADQNERWVHGLGRLEFDAQGRPVMMRGTIMDITERHRADEALRVSLEKYRVLFEIFPLGITVTDPAGQILETNPAAERLLGLAPAEQTQRTIDGAEWRLIRPTGEPMPPAEFASVRALAEGRVVRDVEMGLLRPSGDITWLNVSAAPLPLENYGVVITYHDVTERQQAAAALQASEASLKKSQATAHVGHWIWDTQANRVTWSEEMYRIFGVDPAAFDGDLDQVIARAIHPDDREKVERSNAAVVSAQRPAPLEYRVVWPDQSVHTVWAIPDERVADSAGHIVRLSGIVQDITERKQAEYAVRESEAKYRALYEGASIGIFHSTFEGQYLDLNPALARMLGYASPEEVLASVHDVAEETYVNPGRRAEIVAQVLAQGGFLTTENRYRRRGGADWDAQLHLRCVTDEAGRALYLEGFVEDITERKQAEADLRESKARLDLALQSAQMGAWSLDLLTGQRRFDDQTCRLLGLAPDAYQGTAEEFFGAIDPDDRADVQAAMARTLDEDAPYQPEYRVTWPDGSRHYISGRGRLVRDEAGRPARVLGLIWDITERRRAEEALRIKDRALESSINALAISDLDGRLNYINPAFLDLWGYAEPAEVLGRSAVEFWQWPGQADEIVAALHATGGWAGELLARRPDGSAFEAQIAASLVTNPAGRPLAMLAAFADITARRRAEAELRQTLEELRRSNAELEQFAYVASHDLQEPLRGVTGMLQLLQRKYQGQLNADADELITYAVDAAARMQALINDLLALSRLERRGRPLEPTAAGAALGAALANLDTAITESGAQITAAALPTVLADPTQLIQVFQNLVGNALKFRGPQPPEIQVGAEREAGAWRFWVRDNGIGIEPQYFERIFAVFQRLHTRREYPGTGIGLALCKKIIERHGGRLWVESEPGRGATFYFTLPETSPPHAR